MAVQLQLPVRPCGEPVVVVAVEDDRRVGADARVAEQGAEVLAAGDVAADAVGELAGPVPADRARQVALLVGGRVDVDLDEADVRVARGGPAPSRRRRGCRWWRIRSWCWFPSVLPGRSSAAGSMLGSWGWGRGSGQSPEVGRSRRLNSASRSVHEAASRCAWRTIHGSTRLESSMVTVGPWSPSATTMPRAVAVVGHPVRLELEHDVRDDRGREEPVEVRRVQAVGDVGQPDRSSTLDAGEEVDHPDGRERIAGLGDGRRRERRVGQALRRRAERSQADGRRGSIGHGGVGHGDGRISDWFTRD